MLDRQNALPLYAQLERAIRQKLEDEEWPVNSCIPSESELGRIYGISRMTARSVLNRLADEGLLYRVPGKGTFVAEQKIQRLPASRFGMLDQLNQMGYNTEAQVLSVTETICSRRVSHLLELDRDAPVGMICCLCKVSGIPISYHTSYLPTELFPDLQERVGDHHQLIDIIQKEYHHTIAHHTESLQVKAASPEESGLLQIQPNAPLLLLDTMYYAEDEKPLGCSRVIFRGDKVKLTFDYQGF